MYNTSTDHMIMTGHGFTSTYTPFRNESRGSKDNDPYSINFKLNEAKQSHSTRKKSSVIKNMSILDQKSRADIASAHRKSDEAKGVKTKTSNWLFSKAKSKISTAVPGERKRVYQSHFMSKRNHMKRTISREKPP